MSKRVWLRRWAGALVALTLVGALALAPRDVQAKDVTVFAAASLKNALDAVKAEWEKEGGDKAVVSYAASSALAKQVEAGAPAQIFISADQAWMDYLAERKLVDEASRVNLLGNRIVLAAPADKAKPIEIKPGFDLLAALGDGRLAMANVDSVPAGKYGKSALEKLGVWESVANRVAQAENVRAALLLVSRGEAPLGIVYQTDAAADKGVAVVGTFPEDTHPPIVYPAALVAGKESLAAVSLMKFIQSPKARNIFARHGFAPLF